MRLTFLGLGSIAPDDEHTAVRHAVTVFPGTLEGVSGDLRGALRIDSLTRRLRAMFTAFDDAAAMRKTNRRWIVMCKKRAETAPPCGDSTAPRFCFYFPDCISQSWNKTYIQHILRFTLSCSLHLNITILSKQRFIHLKKFRWQKGKSINYCTALNIYRILILTKTSRSRRTVIMTKCIEIVDRTTQ